MQVRWVKYRSENYYSESSRIGPFLPSLNAMPSYRCLEQIWQWVEWFCDLFTQSSEVQLQKVSVVGFKLESCPVSGYMRDCFLKTEKECLSVAGIPLVPAEQFTSHCPCHFFLGLLSGQLLSQDSSAESEWHQTYLTVLCAKCKDGQGWSLCANFK